MTFAAVPGANTRRLMVGRLPLLFCAVALALAVALAVTAAPATSAEPSPIRVEDGRFVDAAGRTVILRGVNVNQLGDYFTADPSVPSTVPLAASDFARIAALGHNHVRLIVHWSRLEPSPGLHDAAYLDEIRRAVAWARDAGLWVVLDMHQDAWGKHVNTAPNERCFPPILEPAIGWDGAPEWATFTGGASRCALLGVRDLSPAVIRAWQAFWTDRDGIQQHLVETWAWLASAFRDDPTVIGYDLLNEPGWGTNYARTLRTLKGSFYERARAAIRAAETAAAPKIVFFEPLAIYSATQFETVVPWSDDPQIAFGPHIYAESISLLPIPLRLAFSEAAREARSFGRPWWIGEWGWFGSASNYETRFAALEDKYQVGSANWQWKQACGDPHGMSWPAAEAPDTSGVVVVLECGDAEHPEGVDLGVEPTTGAVLSRPYPRRFGGRATFAADPATRALTMQGTDPDLRPIEIWVPGSAEPSLALEGIDITELDAVDGGWILTATPTTPDYELSAVGS